MMHGRYLASYLALGLAFAVAACGKPAAVQPERQIAGQDPAGAAASADAGFPAVPSAEEIAAAAAAAGLPVTPEDRLKLVCDNGEKMVVRYFPQQGIAVLVRAEGTTELNSEPMDMAVRFSNGTTTLTGKGNDYRVEIEGMPPIQCKAA